MAVVVIASHLRCFNRRAMNQLVWLDIVFLVQAFLTHSGCLRYGHFSDNYIARADVTCLPLVQSRRLVSHWNKYDDVTEVFYYDLPPAEAGKYHLMCPHRSPPVTVTAAMVLSWYVTIRDSRYPDSPLLFPGMPPLATRKAVYTKWLKRMLISAVPAFPKKHLKTVRPHGWRAGWVTDRRRHGVPDSITMREGRWSSEQAMGLYDRTAFSVVCPVSSIRYAAKNNTASSRRKRR